MYTLGEFSQSPQTCCQLLITLQRNTMQTGVTIPVHWLTVYGKAGHKQSQGIHMHSTHVTHLMF
jgi:hypothetical protein